MAFTQRPGAHLYWKRDGRDDGPALVLLNSIGTDMDLWDGLLPRLRDRFALLRIDARGHGASVAGAGDYSLAMLADDVFAIADDAGFDRFSVAGVSLGGMIAMEMALRAPTRIEKLMPVCTSATMDAASWDDRIATVRRDGMAAIVDLVMGRFLSDAAEPAVFQAVLRQLLAMDREGYAGCGAAIRDMALADRITGIACPTLIVTGTRDTSTPFKGHGDHLLAQIPGAAHVELEAAHLAPLEASDALADTITLFLET
ncbi:3-oxoadipate enol-lactonase (plasmid) [Rhizorhabdus wittichii RW1]|uniref:3-oxoadipate enol-lactonase n=1 Tax=Rhizorhabdus wittichii (strain DSM 6014 / CCUG 31198 / JCM 15750 / NBRC 105917 / EY 4224 / RW1) TaxID=392499 RepID=A0A9J9HHJ6_RHIWR|nr:3-oxoadipate enol-lactonase [Rhizorhabdus wittichii RW1]